MNNNKANVITESQWRQLLDATDELSAVEVEDLDMALVQLVVNGVITYPLKAVVSHDNKHVFVKLFLDNGRWMHRIHEVIACPDMTERFKHRLSTENDARARAAQQKTFRDEQLKIAKFRASFRLKNEALYSLHADSIKSSFPHIRWIDPSSNCDAAWNVVSFNALKGDQIKRALAHAVYNIPVMRDKYNAFELQSLYKVSRDAKK